MNMTDIILTVLALGVVYVVTMWFMGEKEDKYRVYGFDSDKREIHLMEELDTENEARLWALHHVEFGSFIYVYYKGERLAEFGPYLKREDGLTTITNQEFERLLWKGKDGKRHLI